jgi:hypothetical protein
MIHENRRALAYLAGSLLVKPANENLYDYTSGTYHRYMNLSSGQEMRIIDVNRSCELLITLVNNAGMLYVRIPYGQISFELKERSFEGYDYISGFHYTGNVDDRTIFLFDYQTNQYSSFFVVQ